MNTASNLKKEKNNGSKDGSKEKQAKKRAHRQSTDLENVLSTTIFQYSSLSDCSLLNGGKSYLPMGISHAFAGGKITEPLAQVEKNSNKLSNFYQRIHFDHVRKNVASI